MLAYATPNHAVATNIAGLTLCRGLDRQATKQVAAIGSAHHLRPGQQLFSEDNRADGIYEVVSGMVRLYKLLPDGRRQITGFLSSGHLLGLFHDETYVQTAEAVTDVTVYRYSRAGFERMLDEVPGLAKRLLSATSDELRAAQDQMLLLGRKSAPEKIASFLLTMADRHGKDAVSEEVNIPMARSDIADYLGLTVETVSRTLAKLKHDDAIAIPAACRIELLDRARLEELAAGERD